MRSYNTTDIELKNSELLSGLHQKMNSFRKKVRKNRYPVDSAIHLSYNRPLLNNRNQTAAQPQRMQYHVVVIVLKTGIQGENLRHVQPEETRRNYTQGPERPALRTLQLSADEATLIKQKFRQLKVMTSSRFVISGGD